RDTEKVPKPTSRTSPPPFNAAVIASNTASTALPAAAFDKSALPATASTSSFLFTCCPLKIKREVAYALRGRNVDRPPPRVNRGGGRKNKAFFKVTGRFRVLT